MSEPTRARPADPGPGGHDQARIDLAGYVLGGLTPDEQGAVEAHVATCADCRLELAELEPLPVLLDLATAVAPVTDERGGEPARPTARTAIPSVVPSAVPSAVRSSVRPRRALVGLAVVVAVAAAVVVGVVIGRPSEPSFSAPLALQAESDASADGAGNSAGSGSAAGTAALRATDAGTIVRLAVSGLASGAGTYFECVWTSGEGAQSAGTFRVGSDGSAEVELLTAARLYPGWSLEIVEHRGGDAQGRTVLRAQA